MKPFDANVVRRVPPLLFCALVVVWLALTQNASVGNLALGAALAAALAWATSALRPLQPRMRSLGAAVSLAAVVAADIVRCNVAVARIVLRLHRVESGLVTIPLELRDPHGLAVLAAIVTSTPGTVWVDFDDAKRVLTLHVLDLATADEVVAAVKNRYETRLRRVFE
jgi:multicomponent K+:H+ antiporter subunit E